MRDEENDRSVGRSVGWEAGGIGDGSALVDYDFLPTGRGSRFA